MKFTDYLATFPSIEGIRGLDVLNQAGEVIHHIPAIEGKLGSLKLYHALACQFDGVLNAKSAQQGLIWFAEHRADAELHPGKHPNIDLLARVVADNAAYCLQVRNE